MEQHQYTWSLPTWERGLKSFERLGLAGIHNVAPYMGAWIEILGIKVVYRDIHVAPYMGAWIEIGTSER